MKDLQMLVRLVSIYRSNYIKKYRNPVTYIYSTVKNLAIVYFLANKSLLFSFTCILLNTICYGYQIEEKFHEAATQANNAAHIWVRLKRFNEAERLLRLFIDYTTRGHADSVGATVGGLADPSASPKLCGRAVTVLILIKLYMEDEVAAKKIFNEAVE